MSNRRKLPGSQPDSYKIHYPSGSKFTVTGELALVPNPDTSEGGVMPVVFADDRKVMVLDPRAVISKGSSGRVWGPRDLFTDSSLVPPVIRPEHRLPSWAQDWMAKNPQWDKYGSLTAKNITDLYAALDQEGIPRGDRPVLVVRENGSLIDITIPKLPDSASPIEQQFWNACLQVKAPELRGLIPEYQAGQYRIDFALPEHKTGIELDGFATHSSTADIARDRRRQRDLEAAGWYIIRFGGSEVHHDAESCVRQAARLVRSRTKGGS